MEDRRNALRQAIKAAGKRATCSLGEITELSEHKHSDVELHL